MVAVATTHEIIGVLDLQGGVEEHLEQLERVGIPGKPVKYAQDFGSLAGLIIPGGESTCLARLLRVFELDRVILQEFRRGLKLWGTCAGAILLAREIIGAEPHLALIDLTVQRNAFGTQLDSFTCQARIPRIDSAPVPLTFIRAPKITRVGKEVEVLLRIQNFIAAAENGSVLVTVFHPELTPSPVFHRYFAAKCGLNPIAASTELNTESNWTRTSWMHVSR